MKDGPKNGNMLGYYFPIIFEHMEVKGEIIRVFGRAEEANVHVISVCPCCTLYNFVHKVKKLIYSCVSKPMTLSNYDVTHFDI